MKETEFLENFAKILGASEKLREIEERQQKERRMLESLGAHLGAPVQIEEQEDRDVDSNLIKTQVIEEKIEIVEEKIEEPAVITENVIPPLPELPVNTIVTKSVEMISKAVDTQAAVDDISDPLRRELDAIKKSIADFHRFATRHSQMGGGGAGDVVSLDHQTTSVSTSSYNVGRHDYYIGVDYPDNVAVYLPATAKNGRMLVIKDESGSAGFYPITVVGLVDNDPDGFIIKVNNGAVQLIYSNGWRII